MHLPLALSELTVQPHGMASHLKYRRHRFFNFAGSPSEINQAKQSRMDESLKFGETKRNFAL
jgi:hypothetical protein